MPDETASPPTLAASSDGSRLRGARPIGDIAVK
jgi:hypothetical protein